MIRNLMIDFFLFGLIRWILSILNWFVPNDPRLILFGSNRGKIGPITPRPYLSTLGTNLEY